MKQALLDFVLDAEGDLAIALEAYSAEHLSRFTKSQALGNSQIDLIVDRFLTHGTVGGKTPLTLFLEQSPDLMPQDLHLLGQWVKSFTGLFKVEQVLDAGAGYLLMNWLTAKQYEVRPNGLQRPDQLARFKEGEIVLTRIAPITEVIWVFSGPLILLGKLGKPKLAVAIGNFKQHFKEDLYGDAPELLEEAWNSVAQHHHEWLDFFGQEEVTLPGYQADQRLKQFQEHVTQRRLAEAGLDSTQSLTDLMRQSDPTQQMDEVLQTVASADPAMKAEANPAVAVPDAKPTMVAPDVTMPDRFRTADLVTLITHPKWGQMVSSFYAQLSDCLGTQPLITDQTQKLVRQALADPEMNTFLWHRLAERYPVPLEMLLQATLQDPTFSLEHGLDALLQAHDKQLQPDLPETASVPLHLHNLFQEAFIEVHKTQSKSAPSKSKGKAKSGIGFQKSSGK
ncbi:MAG TPA: hypothetical protein V6D19_14000 [Stenomitos sp.]